jgi:3-deoxy-D-manno-octulosonate 8-phosphate phosphatase (KDO 8-P phosphatase)
MNTQISKNLIDAIIFDFDGVLTDNLVYINQDGNESVCCNRSDGFAIDVLRKLKIPCYILSTEKNKVVKMRANKLQIEAIQGVNDKAKEVKNFSNLNNYKLDKVLYVGNDLNDYEAMKLCGYSVCPSDSHSEIKKIADIVLKSGGGKGVVREIVEDVLSINIIETLYN